MVTIILFIVTIVLFIVIIVLFIVIIVLFIITIVLFIVTLVLFIVTIVLFIVTLLCNKNKYFFSLWLLLNWKRIVLLIIVSTTFVLRGLLPCV